MKALFKNKIMSNAIWIITGKLVQSVLALFVTMMTARYLGPSNYGLIAYAASIVAFVVPIMNLGMSNVFVLEITSFPEDEGKIIGSSVLMCFFSSLACITGIAVYTFCMDVNEPITHKVVIIYSILLVFQSFELIQYWFQAKLISKYVTIASLIAYILVSVYKILLLISDANVYFFAISNSLDYLLISIFLFFVYHKLGGKRIQFSLEIAKRMIKASRHYIISSMMITIYAQTDRIMLKLMTGQTAVGYYSAAVTCATMTSFVFSAIIDSMRPRIFELKKTGDLKEYERGIERTYCFVIYLALAQSIIMTAFAKIIIGILYGTDYEPSIATLQIVVWFSTFSYIGSVRNIWVLGESKQRYLWILNLCGAMVNVALNAVLIPYYGINGAAFASLFTQIFTNIAMNWIIKPLRHSNQLLWHGLNPKLIFSVFIKNN